MTDPEAIDIVVRRTQVERYRWLCSEANTLPEPRSRADYLRWVRDQASRPEYPPIRRQAATLAASLWDWATAGFRVSPAELVEERRAICSGCEEWQAQIKRCRICGCFTEAKIRLKTEHCPLPQPKW